MSTILFTTPISLDLSQLECISEFNQIFKIDIVYQMFPSFEEIYHTERGFSFFLYYFGLIHLVNSSLGSIIIPMGLGGELELSDQS